MGIFTRFKDIINANINSILDKAEDPEKMIKLMMREMEDTLVELKSSTAAKMASQSRIGRELKEAEDLLVRWTGRAQMAVEKGRDDLAREALGEKKNAQNQVDILKKEIDHYTKLIDETKMNIVQLEEKLETVRQKHRILIQRGKHAYEKKQTREQMNQASGVNTMVRFDALEERIERMEAEAELTGVPQNASIENEFSKMEQDDSIEDELAALKKQVKSTGNKKAEEK